MVLEYTGYICTRSVQLMCVCVVCSSWFLLCAQSGVDQNYGKDWFHGSIDRDEAVDLLMRSE